MVDRITRGESWQGEADCNQCLSRESALFSGLEEADLSSMNQPINQYVIAAGKRIYATGDSADSMFTIRSGLVKLVQYLPDGTQRIVRLLRPADVLGIESLVEESYQHDALALQPTELCRYPASVVSRLSASNPQLHDELMRRWHRALTDADTWLTEMSTGSARLRVARLLLRLADDTAEHRCKLFSREDMGAMLGITTETVSRITAEFKRKGVIVEHGGNEFECILPELKQIIEVG